MTKPDKRVSIGDFYGIEVHERESLKGVDHGVKEEGKVYVSPAIWKLLQDQDTFEAVIINLKVVDLDKVHTTPIINPLSNWVYSGNNQNVALTICNGKILFNEGEFTTLNIDQVMDQAQKSTNRMMNDANYTSRGL